jgi:fibronectin type 3 domain-containing protein
LLIRKNSSRYYKKREIITSKIAIFGILKTLNFNKFEKNSMETNLMKLKIFIHGAVDVGNVSLKCC